MRNTTRKKMGKALLMLSLSIGPDAWAGQGWYLMYPPLSSKGQHDEEAPLRKWSQFGAYDTAEQCENALLRWQTSTAKKLQDVTDAKSRAAAQRTWDAIIVSRCIASDDPRLK